MATATTEQKISSLYIAFFDRAGDKAGFDMWVDKLGKGGTLTDIADGFVGHEMFSTKYKGMSDEDFVKAIYKNILGKDGDTEGIANHTKWLGDGTYSSKADFVAKFCESSLTIELTAEKFPNLSADELKAAQARQDLLQNKTKIAVDFVEKLGTQTDIPSGVDASSSSALLSNTEFLASQKIIKDVTEDPETLNTAKKLNIALTKNPDNAMETLKSMPDTSSAEVKKITDSILEIDTKGLTPPTIPLLDGVELKSSEINVSDSIKTFFIKTDKKAIVEVNEKAVKGDASISDRGLAHFDRGDDKKLIDMVTAVEAAIQDNGHKSGEFAFFESDLGSQDNSYLFISDGATGLSSGDILIKLVGVSGLTHATPFDDGIAIA